MIKEIPIMPAYQTCIDFRYNSNLEYIKKNIFVIQSINHQTTTKYNRQQ